MDKHFCPYCMTPVPEGETCPNCGLTAGNYVPSPHHLPPGTVLLGRYLVGRVLGEGGFGITYIGCDLRLEMKVAIKEYYPVNQASRNASASLNVSSLIGPAGRGFDRGKQRFLNEARTMARLDKQSVIVSVRDYFEANNTAYIVMEYIEGTTLNELVEQRGGRVPPDELFQILEPLFGALSVMHDNHLIHRDISPDNLMLENGEIRLLDFGCAREAANGTETLTISLKQGYAPVEQYQSHGGQGPWTDVYALCATIYYCLTGRTPPQAMDRITEDNLILPSKLGVDISPEREQALLKGLRIQQRRRFRSMQELWAALYIQQGPPVVPTPSAKDDTDTPVENDAPHGEDAPHAEEISPAETDTDTADPEPAAQPWWKDRRILTGGAAALIVLALLIALLPKKNAAPEPSPAPDLTEDTALPPETEDSQSVLAPAAEDGWDALFENAAVLDSSDRSRLAELMEDDSVEAIIVRADIPFSMYGALETVKKPVRIDAGVDVHGTPRMTVTENGFLEIRGTFHFGDDVLWLKGDGARLGIAGDGLAVFDVEGKGPNFIADKEENFGNLRLPAWTMRTVLADVGMQEQSGVFANAAVMDRSDPTRFLQLMADDSVEAVILRGDAFALNSPLTITKPMCIDAGVVTGSPNITIEENGLLEVRGVFHFDGPVRLEGSGARVHVADCGYARFGAGTEGDTAVAADEAANLGNLDVPDWVPVTLADGSSATEQTGGSAASAANASGGTATPSNGANSEAAAPSNDPGSGTAASSSSTSGESGLFANAVILSQSDPERFVQLMNDNSVPAIILRVNNFPMDMAPWRTGTTISKPVRIDTGVETGSGGLTVTDSGYLEVCGIFHFDESVRLKGSGARIHIASGGRAIFKDSGAVFTVDEEANLGNLTVPSHVTVTLASAPLPVNTSGESGPFANAVILSQPDLERFVQLMDDSSVPAIILRANLFPMDMAPWRTGTTISKPVRIDTGVETGSGGLTVTGSGYPEVCGIFHFDGPVRLKGSGKRIHVASGGQAVFGNSGVAFTVDEEANLGNVSVPDNVQVQIA